MTDWKQCAWRIPAADPTYPGPLHCIREDGHEGPHKDYSGRWDSAQEYRSICGERGPFVSATVCNLSAGHEGEHYFVAEVDR